MSDSTTLYLDLLKLCLTNFTHGDDEARPVHSRRRLKQWIIDAFAARGIRMVRPTPFDPALRAEGKDWPPNAESMIGLSGSTISSSASRTRWPTRSLGT